LKREIRKKVAVFEDSMLWLFVAPGLLLGVYAQARIQANYGRYSRVGTSSGIAGAQVARALLDARGLQSVRIEATPGMLSYHYDPHSKTLRLSPEVYYTPSLAAAGIAAHETGHALQDAAG
jgi:Zn-dependent membrane protease YugP